MTSISNIVFSFTFALYFVCLYNFMPMKSIERLDQCVALLITRRVRTIQLICKLLARSLH